MLRRLPSLNALKAFEAAARHLSFTKAADELSVTQGAVSHQVKALEAELGLRLFNRERQRLVITDAGRSYLDVVRDAFDRLAVGTNRLLQLQKSGVLTVTDVSQFRRQMAGAPARALRGSASGYRSAGRRIGATHRIRARGYRCRGPPWRRAVVGARA